MLKNVFVLTLLLCVGLLSFSCKKIDQEPEYPFTIIVKTLEDSTRIQNTKVEVYVPPTTGSEVYYEAKTDLNGEVSFEYNKDAVFQVRATRGSSTAGSTPTYIGCTYVKLEPNQRVYQTVYIRPYDPDAPGCTLTN